MAELGKEQEMNMTEGEKETVRFKYVFAEDYNPIYANGAWGGINPDGEIVINFYLQRLALPDSVTHSVGPEGRVGAQMKQEPESQKHTFVRYVTNGVVLDLKHAKTIRDWLDKHIADAEAREVQAKAEE